MSSCKRFARNSMTTAFAPIHASFPATTHDSSPPPLLTVDHKSSGPPMAAQNLFFPLMVEGAGCVMRLSQQQEPAEDARPCLLVSERLQPGAPSEQCRRSNCAAVRDSRERQDRSSKRIPVTSGLRFASPVA